jgi:ribonuclease HI
MATTVYTDGACLGNPGPGGWAWAAEGGRFASGAEAWTTNQRMEITAALEAVRAVDGDLEIASDSTYVVNCFSDRWWEGWLDRDWVTTARKPVANRDLWEPLVELVRARGDVRFRWVKGHAGDPMNELADRLAVEAARAQQGRSGTGWPEGLGEGDAPVRGRGGTVGSGGAVAGAGGPPGPPDGHLLVVAGHRPPELGGYGPNPVAERVRAKLVEILSAKRELDADLLVLTGLGLGAEQLGAEAASDAGVPYVAVLPFPAQEAVWPEPARRRYGELLDGAGATVVLQAAAPRSKQQAGAALARRDAWLARHADEAVVVWDGDDAGVGRLARSFQDALGETEVWLLAPGA